MNDTAIIVRTLGSARCDGRGWTAGNPTYDDRKPSLPVPQTATTLAGPAPREAQS